MDRRGFLLSCACCALMFISSAGCGALGARGKVAMLESHNRILTEQTQAQLAEIENLKAHSGKLESKIIGAEEQLASLDARWRDDRQRLAAFETELTDGRGRRLPPGLSSQLAALSRQYPSLQFDEVTGACKLDTDVLFDSGEAQLKDDAQELLGEFGRILRQPQARDLKLMVVGHTDQLKIARRDVRERYPDNFHLSTARALAVAEVLKKTGVPDDRIGVSGFGGHQPIASNATAEERRLNRRVEIFVLPPDAPVVGWTEMSPSLY